MQSTEKSVVIVERELLALQLDADLPSPAEQIDRLLLWVGEHQHSPGRPVEISVPAIEAWIGAPIDHHHAGNELGWILGQEDVKSIIEQRGSQTVSLRLKMEGWRRYDALKRAKIESRTAFMAMKFGDPELDSVVENTFKPAVMRAGFELRVMTDAQPAGLIDDQMRVRLRTSRFVIADLTHGNNGSYWEAGFAEGLGRPVIYTCRSQEWDDRNKPGATGIHFDTNHLVTVIWDPNDLNDAAGRLVATIRATLPTEAKMTD